MAHAVVGGDVDRGLAGRGARQHRVDLAARSGSQHDRAGLRVDRLDLAYPVVFLGRRRQFVLADAVAGVVGKRGDRRETGLTWPRQVSR